jgi:hypothetical protein
LLPTKPLDAVEEKLSLIVVQEFVTVTLLSFAENGSP